MIARPTLATAVLALSVLGCDGVLGLRPISNDPDAGVSMIGTAGRGGAGGHGGATTNARGGTVGTAGSGGATTTARGGNVGTAGTGAGGRGQSMPGVGSAWTWGGGDDDRARAVAVDASGRIYAVGTTNIAGSYGSDVLIVKHGPGGVEWTRTWGGYFDDHANGVTVDRSGYIWVTGGTMSFGAGSLDMFVLKIDPDGNLVWGTTWGGDGYDDGYDIIVAPNGDIRVVGESYSFGGSVVLLTIPPAGGPPLATSYKSAATYDAGYALTADSNNNVFVAGTSWDYRGGLHLSILILAVRPDGTLLWQKDWITSGHDKVPQTPHAIAADRDGNLYVGASHSEMRCSDLAYCMFDALLLKLDAGGNYAWAHTVPSPDNSTFASVAVDPSGRLFVSNGSDAAAGPYALAAVYGLDGEPRMPYWITWDVGTLVPGAFDMILSGDGRMVVAGAAGNNAGTWVVGPRGPQSPVLPGALFPSSYTIGAPVGATTALTNATVVQTGVVDRGGGETDLFVGEYQVPSCIPGAKANGAPCGCFAECSSGYCVDGVCCQSACNEGCKTCAGTVPGMAGTCVNRTFGSTPRYATTCSVSPVSTCGFDGTCDGVGGCSKYPVNTVCKAGTCDGNATVGTNFCDGIGHCKPGATRICVPFSCNPGTGACFETCTSDANCQVPGTCVNGNCGLNMKGAPCSQGSNCVSGFCADGVCCNVACSGPCLSCNLMGREGTCWPLDVDAVDTRQICRDVGPSTCGENGLCDGLGSCQKYSCDASW